MKVLLTWHATRDEIDQIRNVLPTDAVVIAPPERRALSRHEVTHAEVAAEAAEADVIMGWAVPEGIFRVARNLKALIWFHAGCDELDLAMLKARGIEVASVRGANAVAVAEHAMALMLAVAKRIVIKHQAVLQAHWEPYHGRPEYDGVLLHGKTLALVGLGQIGTAIAERAKAFGMEIIGVRHHPERGHPVASPVFGPEQLDRALGLADFTILAAPLTEETDGFIGEAEIAAMKSTAFLINIARGNMILEQPLHDALTSGRLAGFATDVWWNYTNASPATYHYPIPSRTGLQHLPNVVASGNQAAAGVLEAKEVLTLEAAIENLAAFARGQPMPRRVDLDLGY